MCQAAYGNEFAICNEEKTLLLPIVIVKLQIRTHDVHIKTCEVLSRGWDVYFLKKAMKTQHNYGIGFFLAKDRM